MRYKILLITLLIFSVTLHAQKEVSVYGNVYDRLTTQHLPHVHLTVLRPDSTVVLETEAYTYAQQSVDGVITKTEQGAFSIRVPATQEGYILRFSKESYDTLYLSLELAKLGSREYELKLPPIYMTPVQENTAIELDEVVVKTSKVKFYHKGDTIVYNADAFLLPQGSTLDALIAKLPGVEIRDGGKIYVNGKYVESLLLNGKDFFKGNQDILRQNLGAYAVKNIAVYDKYGQMSKLMDTQIEDDKEFVMDVRLKKDYMGGYLGNAEASYGTSDRYSARLFGMHFNNVARFSVYGNINNVNSSRRPNDSKGFSLLQGNPVGIAKIVNAGFDYFIESQRKDWSVNGNVDVNKLNNLQTSRTFTESFLRRNSYLTSLSENLDKSMTITSNHELKYNQQSYYINLSPSFRYNRLNNHANTAAVEFDSNQQEFHDINKALIDALFTGAPEELREALINRNLFERLYRSNSYRATFKSEQGISLKGSPDAFYVYIEGEYDRDHSDNQSSQTIDYGFNGIDAPASSSFLRRRRIAYPAYSGWIKGAARYYVKSRKSEFSLGYEYRYEQHRKTSQEFMIEYETEHLKNSISTEPYFTPDLGNTNSSKQHASIHMIKGSFVFRSNILKDIYFKVNMRPEFHIRRRDMVFNAYRCEGSAFSPIAVPICRSSLSFNNCYANLSFWTEDNKHDLDIEYRFNTVYVPLTDLIDIPNTVDPLNVYHGNPALKDAYNQNVRLQYLATPWKNSMLSLVSTFDYTSRDIVKGYTFNSNTGVREFKTLNLSGNLSNRNVIAFNKSHDFGEHQLSYEISGTYAVYRYANMIGEDGPMLKQVVHTNGFNYGLQAEYSYMNKYTIGGRLDCINNFSCTDSGKGTKTIERRMGPRTWLNLKLPFNLSFNCDFQYLKINGTESIGMNPDQCRLNATLRYQLNANWSFRIEGYDLLGQQKPYSNVVSATGRTQSIINSLPRYCMLSVGYRFSTKKKQ